MLYILLRRDFIGLTARTDSIPCNFKFDQMHLSPVQQHMQLARWNEAVPDLESRNINPDFVS